MTGYRGSHRVLSGVPSNTTSKITEKSKICCFPTFYFLYFSYSCFFPLKVVTTILESKRNLFFRTWITRKEIFALFFFFFHEKNINISYFWIFYSKKKTQTIMKCCGIFNEKLVSLSTINNFVNLEGDRNVSVPPLEGAPVWFPQRGGIPMVHHTGAKS